MIGTYKEPALQARLLNSAQEFLEIVKEIDSSTDISAKYLKIDRISGIYKLNKT